jgi:hypothetical protein
MARTLAPAVSRVSFKDFVMLSKWQSSRKYFSLIWLHTIYESKENTNSFYILELLMKLTFKIWKLGVFFLQNLANSMIKNLCIGWIHIFQVEVWGNFANNRNAAVAQLTQGS